MRLLICTQKVNLDDANLGFFHRWIEEFARHCERVTVICLEEGRHQLPQNVRVFSLGKVEKGSGTFCLKNPKGASRKRFLTPFRQMWLRLNYAARFFRYIWRERKNYDAVFVHMNPEYLVLAGWLWKILGKESSLWYTHHSITPALRLGVLFTNIIFSAARESFRLATSKPVYVFGHGIDTEHFLSKQGFSLSEPPVLISVGRISRSKNLHLTLETSRELRNRGIRHELKIVGEPITPEDETYLRELQEVVAGDALRVTFVGGVSYAELATVYRNADIFLSQANVGGLNKTVLEAMACNLYVITSNEAYRGILPDAEIIASEPTTFSLQIANYLARPRAPAYRTVVVRDHSLPQLITKIVRTLGGHMAK